MKLVLGDDFPSAPPKGESTCVGPMLAEMRGAALRHNLMYAVCAFCILPELTPLHRLLLQASSPRRSSTQMYRRAARSASTSSNGTGQRWGHDAHELSN